MLSLPCNTGNGPPLVVVHDGRCAAMARPLKEAVEERTEAVLDVAAARRFSARGSGCPCRCR
jgi:hypothetical protein